MKYLKSYDKQNINEKLISKEELDNMGLTPEEILKRTETVKK